MRSLAEKHPNEIVLATTAAEVRAAHKAGKFAALMGMEGGHMIDDSLAVLRDYQRLTRGVSAQLATLRNEVPEVMRGFGELSRAALAGGALSEKTKELIALALGVAGHCDACIGFHVKALVRLGASRRELEEALAVAVYMGGGPSLMYSANALAAYAEFAAPVAAAEAA